MHESIPSIMLSKDLIDPDSVFNYAATHWDHFVDVVKKNMEESGVPMTADKANEVLTSIMESNYGFRPTYAVRDASLKQLNLPNYAAEAADIKKKWYKASTKYTPDSGSRTLILMISMAMLISLQLMEKVRKWILTLRN